MSALLKTRLHLWNLLSINLVWLLHLSTDVFLPKNVSQLKKTICEEMVAIISDLLTIVFTNMPFILLFFGINFIQVPIHLLFQPFVFISGISVILQRCEYAYSKIFLSISFYRSPFAEPLKRRIQGKKIDRSNIIKNH